MMMRGDYDVEQVGELGSGPGYRVVLTVYIGPKPRNESVVIP